MITPLRWLERVPTNKDQQEQLKRKDLATFGFLGYPVVYSLPTSCSTSPLSFLWGKTRRLTSELTREVARRFNQFYPRDFHLST